MKKIIKLLLLITLLFILPKTSYAENQGWRGLCGQFNDATDTIPGVTGTNGKNWTARIGFKTVLNPDGSYCRYDTSTSYLGYETNNNVNLRFSAFWCKNRAGGDCSPNSTDYNNLQYATVFNYTVPAAVTNALPYNSFTFNISDPGYPCGKVQADLGPDPDERDFDSERNAIITGSIYQTTTNDCTGAEITPPFNFSLSNGGDKTVQQGSSVTNSISITRSQGTTQSVSLAASTLSGSGVTFSFSPTSCTPSDTCSSTLTITASSTATTGNRTIKVTGTAADNSVSHYTEFSLDLTAAPPPTTPNCTVTAVPTGTDCKNALNEPIGKNVIGTVTINNIPSYAEISWRLGKDGTSSMLNDPSSRTSLTRTMNCVEYTSNGTLETKIKSAIDGDYVNPTTSPPVITTCLTSFSNPAPGTGQIGGVVTTGATGDFVSLEYNPSCGPPYDDNRLNIGVNWTTSDNNNYAFHHYKAWIDFSFTDAIGRECFRGTDNTGDARNGCRYDTDISGAANRSYAYNDLEIYNTSNNATYHSLLIRGYNYDDAWEASSPSSGWISSAQQCPPNLVVVEPGFSPANSELGGNMSFWGTVKEQGWGLNAPSSITRLYIKKTTGSDTSFYQVPFDKTTDNLTKRTGEENERWDDLNGTNSNSLQSAGNYAFKICANATNRFAETSYSDNCSREVPFTIAPAPLPDLDPDPTINIYRGSELTPIPDEGNIYAGDSLYFMATLLNNGISNAGYFYSHFCRDAGTETNCYTTNIDAIRASFDINWYLNAGQTTNYSSAANGYGPRAATAGNHTVYFCADTSRVITETSENNNCVSKTFNVISPWQPWIQVEGDMHSNTRIDLSGGP